MRGPCNYKQINQPTVCTFPYPKFKERISTEGIVTTQFQMNLFVNPNFEALDEAVEDVAAVIDAFSAVSQLNLTYSRMKHVTVFDDLFFDKKLAVASMIAEIQYEQNRVSV